MHRTIKESDWKYLRKRQDDMLNTLCLIINQKAKAIVESTGKSEHKKYLWLYNHIRKSDKIIADCFNDWSRSDMLLRIPLLRYHGLITDEDLNNMSQDITDVIELFNK